MGLSITYRQHIYDQIKTAETNSKVKLTPALRREIFDLYANMIMKPTMTPEETIEFIELHPRKVNRPIRPLRRFTAEERAERKKKALTLNRLQRDYCIDQGETVKFYGNKGTKNERSFEREPQQFFIIPEPGATEEELAKINQHNTEVAFLFNKKETWSKYSEEENKQFARRRAEIMLGRLADNYETVKNLPNLVDENLSPEELAKNYRKVINTCNLFTCIEVYCQDATNSFTGMNNFYDFKEEEIKLLYDTYRPLIADATNYQLRALMIANPAYEFLDIDGLQDYDVEDLDHGLTKEIGVFECDDESDFLEGDAKKFYQKMERKGHVNRTAQLEKMEPDIQDEFFKRHTKDADENEDENENENEKKPLIFTPEQTKAMTKFFKELNKTKIPRFLHDPVSDLFADYDFYYQTMRYEIQDNFKKVKQDYLLGGSDTTLYSERITKDGFEFTNDANEHRLYEGIPVALEKNDRVIILTPNQSDGMGGVTVDKPESLYNYGLKKEFSTFTKRLKDADPLLLKSSSQYKEMQKSLAEIGKLAELQPGQSTAKAYLKFQKLLNSTEIYLRHKEDGVMDDDDRSSIELRRVKAARDLRKFALAKLKELELTNQARATLNKYKDMDPEARKEALAAEDARAKELKQRAAADKAARKAREEQEAAPLDWFEKQMKTPDRVASLPKAFQDAFAIQIKQLKNELVPDTDDTSEHFYEDFSTYQQQLPTQLAHTLGGMIAAELILQERKDYDMGEPGPLETFFSRNNDNSNENSPLYQALLFLGEDALKKALKKADPKKNFDHIESLTLDEREVKKLLENFHAADYVAPDSAKEFAKNHVYSLPVEVFNKDYSKLVPAGLDQSIKENLSGFYLERPDQLDSVRLLAGSVIAAEMIAKERELLFDGNVGPIETALTQDGKDGLRKLGDKVLEHCPGMADSNDVMTAFYLMDPAKLADELTFDFRKEHGLSTSLEGSLKEQYCSIKPLRGDKLDDYEQVLAGYANMQILEPLQKYGPDLDVISEEDSRTILSSCALCSMVIMERAKGGEQPGVMESLLLKDPEQFEAIRHNIETSPDFNKLISPALTPNGIPVSSLSYMTKLLKDTGLVVNIIDNTKEVIKQKQPASEKAKEKAQPTAQASRRRRCRERLERNRRQKAQAPKKA